MVTMVITSDEKFITNLTFSELFSVDFLSINLSPENVFKTIT